jgi:predicted nuclease with TOPRIM domain
MIQWAIFSSVIVSAVTFFLGTRTSSLLGLFPSPKPIIISLCSDVDTRFGQLSAKQMDLAHTIHSVEFLRRVVRVYNNSNSAAAVETIPLTSGIHNYNLSSDYLMRLGIDVNTLPQSDSNNTTMHEPFKNVDAFYSALLSTLNSLYSMDPMLNKLVIAGMQQDPELQIVDNGDDGDHYQVNRLFAENVVRSTNIIDRLSQFVQLMDVYYGQHFVGNTTFDCLEGLTWWNVSVKTPLALGSEAAAICEERMQSLNASLADSISSCTARADGLESRVIDAEDRLASVLAGLNELKSHTDEVEGELNSCSQEHGLLSAQLQAAQTELTLKATQAADSAAQVIAAKQAEIDKLLSRISELEAMVSTATCPSNGSGSGSAEEACSVSQAGYLEDIQKLTNNLNESHQTIEQLNTQLQQRDAECENSLESLRQQAWTEIQEGQQSLQKSQTEADNRVQELESTNQELQARFQQVSADLQFNVDQLQQLQTINAELRKSVSAVPHSSEDTDCASVLTEFQRCQGQLQSLQAAHEALQFEQKLCSENDNFCQDRVTELEKSLQFAEHNWHAYEEEKIDADNRIEQLERLSGLAESRIDELERERDALQQYMDELSRQQISQNGHTAAAPTVVPSGSGFSHYPSVSSSPELKQVIPIRRADFASRNAGASIVKHLSSPSYVPTNVTLPSFIPNSILGFFGTRSVGTHEDAITEDMKLGSCWPMQGSSGTLVIKLFQPIILDGISIEHLSR